MGVIDIDVLTTPVPGEAGPLGPDVEDCGHDDFSKLETAYKSALTAESAPAGARGSVSAWEEVRDLAMNLLGKSKQLRVAVYLTSALTRMNGYEGFYAGLAVIAKLLTISPDGCHPVNDSGWRSNILQALNDRDDILGALRKTPLTNSRVMGRWSYRDYELATGSLKLVVDNDEEVINEVQFLNALQQTDAVFRERLSTAIKKSLVLLDSIESLPCFTNTSTTLAFADVRKHLQRCTDLLAGYVNAANAVEATFQPQESAAPNMENAAPVHVSAVAACAEIGSVADCKRLLQEIVGYLNRTQPAHPAPLFIARAVRLLDMSFVEIIQDLTPESYDEVRRLSGLDRLERS